MKVIGLVGELAAGKSIVAKFMVEHYDAQVIVLSDILRQVALEEGEPNPNRQYLQDLGDRLRKEHGGQVLVKIALETVDRKGVVIIDGIRNTAEVKCLQGRNGQLIAIKADKEIRFQRMLARQRSDDPKTWEEFLEMEQNDLHGGNEYGQRVAECLSLADVTIFNNGEAHLVHKELESHARKEL